MKSSTIEKTLKFIAPILWIGVWEILSLIIDEELFLPSPITVIVHFFSLVMKKEFCFSILFSFSRITFGFLLSLVIGLLFAFISNNNKYFRIVLEPLIKLMKSIPVASIVILLLLWMKSKNLSVAVVFLIAFPIIYTNTLTGLLSIDKETLEMAEVYKIKGLKKLRNIDLPYLESYILSALKVSIALAWKSGTASEVIALPTSSIGEKLYISKLYFASSDLFAWTLTIVILSYISEKIIVLLSNKLYKGVILK